MFVLRCRLIGETFEGGSPDSPNLPEWPPSWMRLFSALVAVADHGDADEVKLLEHLERLPAPAISAEPLLEYETPGMSFVRDAWVPTNSIEGQTGSTMVGRKNGARGWARFVPKSPVIDYIWTDETLPGEQLALLSRLCRRVPYLGRSTSPVIVELLERVDSPERALQPRKTFDAQPLGEPPLPMRAPFPGALDALRAAHDRKMRGESGDPWTIGAFVDYQSERSSPSAPIVNGPYRQLVILQLEGPARDGRHAVEFTDLLRKAIMANLPSQLPEVHGHGPAGTVQCAFFALPFVGHPHADGHIVGLAVAIPEMPPHSVQLLMEALDRVTSRGIGSARLGQFALRRLTPVELRRSPVTLQPWRWTRPSTTWVTAYPAVLDRFPKRAEDVPAFIRLTITNAGLPEPVEVRSAKMPFDHLAPGALNLLPHETLRPGHNEAIRPYRHLLIQFAFPVRGPVVVGSMRHYGLGLCLPIEAAATVPPVSYQHDAPA